MESSNLVADKIDLLISKTALEVKEKMKNIKGNGRKTRVSSASSASSNDSGKSELSDSSCANGPTYTPITASESELSMLKTNNDRSFRESRSGFSVGASSIPYSHSVAGSQLADVSSGLVFYSIDGKYKIKLQMNEKNEIGQIKSRVSINSKVDNSEPEPKAASMSGSIPSVLSSPEKSEEKVSLPNANEKPMGDVSSSWSQMAECTSSIGTKLSVIDGGREHSLRLKAGLFNGKFDTLVINGKNIKLSQ